MHVIQLVTNFQRIWLDAYLLYKSVFSSQLSSFNESREDSVDGYPGWVALVDLPVSRMQLAIFNN